MNRHPSTESLSGTGLLTLFASTGTLICCALPIVLVSLGMGASVAAMTSAFPFLITLSRYKELVFLVSGLLLAGSGWVLHRPGRCCPADPESARACRRAANWNRRIYWTAMALWGIGFFAAFLALPLRIRLGW